MTSLFICPLLRNKFRHSYLRDMAKRSVIAACIALSVSCVNISILAAAGGTSAGGVLLACWEGDVRPFLLSRNASRTDEMGMQVLVSATTFFWLTSGSALRAEASSIPAAVRSCSPIPRSGGSRQWRISTAWSTFLNGDNIRQSSTLPTGTLDVLPQDVLAAPVPHTVLNVEEKNEASEPVIVDLPPVVVDMFLARPPVLQRAPRTAI